MGFFGKASYHPDADNGWEPFSNSSGGDDYCAADWAKSIHRAKALGVKVQFTTKGITMAYGDLELNFKDAQGGVKLAERFLGQIESGEIAA
jgi:hypothetical protein